MNQKVVLILGSKSDQDQADKICTVLDEFGVPYQVRIASAHRTPKKVMKILSDLENSKNQTVVIVVAGLSNALSGMISGISAFPVVTCPVYDFLDINSSLRMPSGVAHGTVLKPANAAIFVLKILALSNPKLENKIKNYLQKRQQKIEQDDAKIQRKSS